MDFIKEYKKGVIGEELAINYFKRKGWIVYDVRNEWFYRKKDIDFIIEMDNRRFSFEVKTQKRINQKHEIIVETCNLNLNKDGWFYYSECDYFLFVNPEERKGYIISAFSLKEYIENSNFEEQLNSYSNCLVYYLDLREMPIYQEINL